MLPEAKQLVVDGMPVGRLERPRSEAEVAERLVQAIEENCAVVPLGGGTMLELGAPIMRADIALATENLTRVLDHQPANLTVTAEAGITLAALNEFLARAGQFLPLDAPFPARATLGGILATNASGPLRLRYGTARDLLIGIHVALPEGKIVRAGGQVVKNVAGYDLNKLYIGALGTLGVITQATFKVQPLTPGTATVVASFSRLTAACSVIERLTHSPLLPLSAEVIDHAAARALSLPEGYAIAARFGGSPKAVARQASDLENWARENGAASAHRVEPDVSLWSRLRDYPYEHEVLARIGVPPAKLGSTGAEVERVAAAWNLNCSFVAHSAGVILASIEGTRDAALRALETLRAFAEANEGYLVVQRAPRELRERIDAWGPVPSGFQMMSRLKREFDPKGILNPGRFAGGL